MSEASKQFLDMTKRAADGSVMRKLVLSKLQDKSIKKAVLEPKDHRGSLIYTIELYMQDGKKTQKIYDALPTDEIEKLLFECMQANLVLSVGECEYKASKKGNDTILGKGKLDLALKSESNAEMKSLNHEKNYILRGDEAFLYALDITDKNGRIKDKRQAKFRQICRFLEYVRDMLGILLCSLSLSALYSRPRGRDAMR